MTIVEGKFKDTGINKINIDLVVSKWNHLWMLTEWKIDNSWRVVKYVRKDSPLTDTKITISCEQANELINKLGLISINGGFKSGFSWRTEKDIEFLSKKKC